MSESLAEAGNRLTLDELFGGPTPAHVGVAWAGYGWRVLPVRVDGPRKRPALKNWPQLASTDVYEVGRWLNWDFEGCWPGIATGRESGIWVLDIDRHGADGFDSLQALENWHGKLPRTFTVKTLTGGEHRYWAYPSDGEIKTTGWRDGVRADPNWAGLDSRGRGGMVVAPMAGTGWGPGARRYEITDDLEPQPAPSWLVEHFRWTPHRIAPVFKQLADCRRFQDIAHGVMEREHDELASCGEGRNIRLNQAAYTLGGLGAHGLVSEAEAYQLLVVEACATSGLLDDDGEDQCASTFRSGWLAGLQSPAWLPSPDLQSLVDRLFR